LQESQQPNPDLTEFVHRWSAPLFRYCWGQLRDQHLAEDAVQETFLRTWRRLGKGNLENLPAWLFGVARHCCQEIRRRQKKAIEQLSELTETAPAAPSHDSFDESLESALESLNDADRSLIYLKHVQGLKCREIAELLNKPVGTITGTLARIYRKLRSLLDIEES
jgi:RNA polymerase sigma-70 factor (ECF subfamily)